MKKWRCPSCGREKEHRRDLVIKVCWVCQDEMEVIEDDN